MSLFSVRRANPIDIGQANPWLQTFVAGWWFAPLQPDHGRHRRGHGRVRALIGRRMKKQARHAGVHEVCEPPHASDDARLDLSNHRQAVRLSSEGSDSRSIRAVQLRPQLNSGSRFRTERTFPMPGTVVVSGVWARVASSTPDAIAHGPPTCPPRSWGLPHRLALRSCRIMSEPIRGEATRRAQSRLCS